MEKLISTFLRETKSEAVSVVTYDHGTVEYFGERNGLFQIGSMTKAFTGLAVQKLIHEGKLAPESRVSELLPGFESYYHGEKDEITVKQLMTQMSGYTNNEKDYPSAKKGESLAGWTKRLSGKSLQSAPGEQYAYSNANFNLLGAIIEEVSGMSYLEYMEREILTPLGLEHTYVGEPQDGNVVQGSRLFFRHVVPYEVPVREGAIPAGYFYSNLEDMGRWMEIWLGTADIPEDYQELILEVKAQLGTEEGAYYGGWERFEDGVIGHSGGTANYSSRITFSEKDGVGACVLTNLNVAASTDSLCNSLLKRLKGDEPGGIAGDVWTVFDKIFSALCVLFGGIFLICIKCRKRGMLIAVGTGAILLLVILTMLLSLIFGAGPFAILFGWAPWSLAAFYGILLGCGILAIVRALLFHKKEDGENG
ncbi:MAG: beta-lactamase family protein [Lachnospiraceae bacterium]|nr:beta-lactamase family protein [Lachnospiraceae bacterium]